MFLKVCLKHGEKLRMWLNQLKIAIVQKDMQLLDSLLSDIPTFVDTKEIESASYLLKEASAMVSSLKDETASSMIQIKKNVDFLRSTQSKNKNTLDISS